MYKHDMLTMPANIAGLPAITIPCGNDGNNLPIGLQMMSKQFAEDILIRTAYTFEQNTNFHKNRPVI
jgi:aspartyl-tRNA(Asn)/glutamyl-tRNA(Gln) amidotransferase subunit A